MKALYTMLMLSLIFPAMAQIAINNTGTPPDASAMLDVKSESKGLLVPRMTQANRNAIISPATGLMIFQTDNTPGYYYNAGTPATPAWNMLGGTANPWMTGGSYIYYNGGKVGIGTATPKALLHTYGTGPGGGSLLAEGLFKDKPDAPPTTGAGTRLMWYPDKAAFRAGEVTGVNWNKDSIGNHSVAMGLDTRAKGMASVAMGNASLATADYAVALGAVANASGTRSVAIGAGTSASNSWTTAFGSYTTASGLNATAIGYMNHAEGNYSLALGDNTRAYSKSEMVVGSYNSAYMPVSKTAWAPADRLFVIGNGAEGIGHNAVTVLKNGKTGIGIDTPRALLHAYGPVAGSGIVYFEGYMDQATELPPIGNQNDARFLWFPDRGALRAGIFSIRDWKRDNIGKYSLASGYMSKASGYLSFAHGDMANAEGWGSVALGGSQSEAKSDYSVVIGGGVASGRASVAIMGVTYGDRSMAFGGGQADAYESFAIGHNNVGGGSPTTWILTDPLFEIGNSNDPNTQHNALTILKNGNTTVGGSLTTEGNVNVTGNLGATGNVLANGDVTATGKVKVNGSKGIVRTITGDQMKTLEVQVVVNTTISGGATANISFTFPEAYSVAPTVYVGNVATGGGFAEVVMSVGGVTTTGGKLFIYNPKSGAQSPNFTVKMVALGKE